MKTARWLLLGVLLLLVLAFFQLELYQYLTLDALQQRQQSLGTAYRESPMQARLLFFVAYVTATTLSLPGTVLLTLASGAIFGFGWGLVLSSFASSIGALLSFGLARYVLRDTVQRRFAGPLETINQGMQANGAWYLFSLRLLPLVPYFAINLAMGLTTLPARTFYWVSQLGMLTSTLLYVNAGQQLARLHSLADLYSPALVASFALLATLPMAGLALRHWWQDRRAAAPWAHLRPRRFERNLVVIGAGAAGLVASYIAAALQARVTLVEARQMGGDCLNHGCVPSKALIHSARLAHQLREARKFGLNAPAAVLDFPAVMARIQQVIRDIAPHDSVARYTGLGVDVVQGHARITTPWTVEVSLPDGSTRTITTRSIVIATGAQPVLPDLPGLDGVPCCTSDTLWDHLARLDALPPRIVLLGGGPIGCELAQAFARLGAEVHLLDQAAQILPREDADVVALAQAALEADGVQVLTAHQALRCESRAGNHHLVVQHAGNVRALAFDLLVCATGRVARLQGFGLEELGIPCNTTVQTNAFLQTVHPNIYAAGDVAGPYQFTHTAAHQAWYATLNALFGDLRRTRVRYAAIPQATFLDPELARVGRNEREAQAEGLAYVVTRFDLADLDRAITDGATQGFVKVLTAPGSDRILGATVVGRHASELIAEYVLAMQHQLGLNKILGTVHTYPTMAEANKSVAGVWRRQQAPRHLLRWLGRWQAWRRG